MRLYIAVDINDPNDELAGDHGAHLADEIVSDYLVREQDGGNAVEYRNYKVTVVAAGRNLIAEVQ